MERLPMTKKTVVIASTAMARTTEVGSKLAVWAETIMVSQRVNTPSNK